MGLWESFFCSLLYFSNFSTMNIYYIYVQKIKTSMCVYCLFITLIIRQDRDHFFQRAFPEFLRLHFLCSLSLSYTSHQMLLCYTEIPKQQQKHILKGSRYCRYWNFQPQFTKQLGIPCLKFASELL